LLKLQPRHYNLHIIGVSESRLTGSGRQTPLTGETLLYTGRDQTFDSAHRTASGEFPGLLGYLSY